MFYLDRAICNVAEKRPLILLDRMEKVKVFSLRSIQRVVWIAHMLSCLPRLLFKQTALKIDY